MLFSLGSVVRFFKFSSKKALEAGGGNSETTPGKSEPIGDGEVRVFDIPSFREEYDNLKYLLTMHIESETPISSKAKTGIIFSDDVVTDLECRLIEDKEIVGLTFVVNGKKQCWAFHYKGLLEILREGTKNCKSSGDIQS